MKRDLVVQGGCPFFRNNELAYPLSISITESRIHSSQRMELYCILPA